MWPETVTAAVAISGCVAPELLIGRVKTQRCRAGQAPDSRGRRCPEGLDWPFFTRRHTPAHDITSHGGADAALRVLLQARLDIHRRPVPAVDAYFGGQYVYAHPRTCAMHAITCSHRAPLNLLVLSTHERDAASHVGRFMQVFNQDSHTRAQKTSIAAPDNIPQQQLTINDNLQVTIL